MSQLKVDEYKEHKKNRKQEVKKERRKKQLVHYITILVIVLLAAALVVGIVFTVRNSQKDTTADYEVTDFEVQDYANIQGTAETVVETTEAE